MSAVAVVEQDAQDTASTLPAVELAGVVAEVRRARQALGVVRGPKVREFLKTLPAGTSCSTAFSKAVTTGLYSNTLGEYQAFQQVAKRAMLSDSELSGRVLFNGRRSDVDVLRERMKAIAREFANAGKTTGVRDIGYVLLGEGLIPDMTASGGYSKVSDLLTELRDEWSVDEPDKGINPSLIVDESRSYNTAVNVWSDFSKYLRSIEDEYRVDVWRAQPERVEVWTEKNLDLDTVLEQFRVTQLVTHGHLSTGAASMVARAIARRAQPLHVLYLGDWDCAGLTICDKDGVTGTIQERMEKSLVQLRAGGVFRMTRIALTNDDVERLGPDLAVPTKDDEWARERGNSKGDTTAENYVDAEEEYGRDGSLGWEVNALFSLDGVNALDARVAEEIQGAIRDSNAWESSLALEREQREWLEKRNETTRRSAGKQWPS